MLPVNGCGIGVVCDGLTQSQEHGSGQLFRKIHMEAYSLVKHKLIKSILFFGVQAWSYTDLFSISLLQIFMNQEKMSSQMSDELKLIVHPGRRAHFT
jgi:hypothetical protein